MTNLTQSLKVILLAVVLSFGVSYVFAWTAPTVAPTGGNSTAPLNTSNNTQTKNGNLFLNALGITNTAPNALSVLGGGYFGENVGVGTTTPAQKLTVVGTIESTAGGIKFPDGTTQVTAASGGKIIVSSITGAFAGSYLYTALLNTHPVSLTVTISAYGGSSTGGSAEVRWLDDAGIVVRDWKKISGTNIANGNDGGSGMRDMELATIPFLDGSTKIEFRGVGNGYNGELISYTYQN